MLISQTKKIRSQAPAYGSQLLQIQNQLQSQINHSQNQLSQQQTIFSQINPFTYTYLTKKKENKNNRAARLDLAAPSPTAPAMTGPSCCHRERLAGAWTQADPARPGRAGNRPRRAELVPATGAWPRHRPALATVPAEPSSPRRAELLPPPGPCRGADPRRRRHRVGGAPMGPSHPCRCSRLGRALAAARQPHPHRGGSRGPEGGRREGS